ncbi:hypothetical protein R1sor_023815 [Riccia sorocarpa]|uniref:Uncharacterized protein n=1 Tax=Riccia sorocarpa TaxID=122646 RepID=A0ABD3GST2_9MARC
MNMDPFYNTLLKDSEKWADVMDKDKHARSKKPKNKPTEGGKDTRDRGNNRKTIGGGMVIPEYQRVDTFSQLLVEDNSLKEVVRGGSDNSHALLERNEEPLDKDESLTVPEGHTAHLEDPTKVDEEHSQASHQQQLHKAALNEARLAVQD